VTEPAIAPESRRDARVAGLRYVSDESPGITRRRAGRGFVYLSPHGRRVRDQRVLARIRSLAVPPAWTDVWICPAPTGHLQATGRDARGRKQYRYHAEWRRVRDEAKFDRLSAFGRALPAIRRRVAKDLAREGLPREKVVAAAVRLLDQTLIRPGNTEYTRTNGSYGVTTLLDEHVDVFGDELRFSFRGKGGKDHEVRITDRRLARVVKRCQELPGEVLFAYLDEEGGRRPIGSDDVNDYVRRATGEDFTAKDFRTWGGTVLAAQALAHVGPFSTEAEAKARVAEGVREVAATLGNTPQVCRNCYVHPVVIDAYLDGSLSRLWPGSARRRHAPEVRPEEAGLMALLDRRRRSAAA
jgi:DNA topoisomerase I